MHEEYFGVMDMGRSLFLIFQILFDLYFLALSTWDLSSLTKHLTQVPLQWKPHDREVSSGCLDCRSVVLACVCNTTSKLSTLNMPSVLCMINIC